MASANPEAPRVETPKASMECGMNREEVSPSPAD